MIINRTKTFNYVAFLVFRVLFTKLMDGQSLRAKYWNVHEEVLQEELHFLRMLNKLMTKFTVLYKQR